MQEEEILALKWDSVYLDVDCPYLTVRRAWHTENNRPVILDELKTKAAHRNIPLPVCLADCLKETKETSTSVGARPGGRSAVLHTVQAALAVHCNPNSQGAFLLSLYEDGRRISILLRLSSVKRQHITEK